MRSALQKGVQGEYEEEAGNDCHQEKSTRERSRKRIVPIFGRRLRKKRTRSSFSEMVELDTLKYDQSQSLDKIQAEEEEEIESEICSDPNEFKINTDYKPNITHMPSQAEMKPSPRSRRRLKHQKQILILDSDDDIEAGDATRDNDILCKIQGDADHCDKGEHRQLQNQTIEIPVFNFVALGEDVFNYVVTRRTKVSFSLRRTYIQLMRDSEVLYSIKYKGEISDNEDLYINSGNNAHISGSHFGVVVVTENRKQFSLRDETKAGRELACLRTNTLINEILCGFVLTIFQGFDPYCLIGSYNTDVQGYKFAMDMKHGRTGKNYIQAIVRSNENAMIRAIGTIDPLCLIPLCISLLSNQTPQAP